MATSSFFDPKHPSAGEDIRRARSRVNISSALLLGAAASVLTLWFFLRGEPKSAGAASGAALLALGYAFALHFFRARRRRAGYFSGQPARVRQSIAEDLVLANSPTRFRALALAGVGDFGAARRALMAPGDGPKDEDEELELCARIVAESFEGRSEDALVLCRELIDVPLDSLSGGDVRRQARRAGVLAIARTVSGAADEVDLAELARTPTFEPSLFWACRYSAALSCCVRGEASLARGLVQNAPGWPAESFFCELQGRILASAPVHQHERAQVA